MSSSSSNSAHLMLILIFQTLTIRRVPSISQSRSQRWTSKSAMTTCSRQIKKLTEYESGRIRPQFRRAESWAWKMVEAQDLSFALVVAIYVCRIWWTLNWKIIYEKSFYFGLLIGLLVIGILGLWVQYRTYRVVWRTWRAWHRPCKPRLDWELLRHHRREARLCNDGRTFRYPSVLSIASPSHGGWLPITKSKLPGFSPNLKTPQAFNLRKSLTASAEEPPNTDSRYPKYLKYSWYPVAKKKHPRTQIIDHDHGYDSWVPKTPVVEASKNITI